MDTATMDVGGPVHVADFGGSGPVMVLLHGLGGSHVNWMRAGPRLAERGRVMAPDFPGFGRTPPAGRSSSVHGLQRFVGELVEQVGSPAILVGNSLGGLVAILEAAVEPERVAGVVLVNPAVPPPRLGRVDLEVALGFAAYMTPGIGEVVVRRRAATLGAEGLVRETYRMCGIDPEAVPEDMRQAQLALSRDRLTMPWANAAVLRAARTMLAVILRRRRFRALLRSVRAPTLLLAGETDRFVSLPSARAVARARPDWQFRELPAIGHTPQISNPDAFVDAVWEWLDGPGAEAGRRAAVAASAAAESAF